MSMERNGAGPTATPDRDGRHTAQFYQDEAYLFDVVTSFVIGGLDAGQPLILVITRPHWNAVAARLSGRGVDVEAACATERVVRLDAQETLERVLDGGMPDAARFRQVIGAVLARAVAGHETRGARAYGEMVDLLWRDGRTEAALRLEQCWNELLRGRPISLLCSYAMEHFDDAGDLRPLERICDAHTYVAPTESWARLGGDGAQEREVTLLQQRARALAGEIARRKEVEHELRRARAEAEAANRAKDEFLAMLGHELRNPLAPIVTALQLMKLRGDARASREQDIIERQVQSLVRLVDDLLDTSRITRGQFELRRARIDLRDAIAKAVEIAGPMLEERRHRFDVEVPRVPIRVDADEARLAQVFANLLGNAAKYTAPGGHVSLTVRAEGDQAIVEVIDDGIGIAPELLPRVFELFVQGRRDGERTAGLGIGLSLARNLVAMHGGRVEARSDGLGRGSRFVVSLPAQVDDARAAIAGSASPLAAPRQYSPRRILLVDDNDDAVELVAEVLRALGHEVQTAPDAEVALRMVRAFAPEVAILDIGLPTMDGYELAERLRHELGAASPRLVALTGYGQDHDRVRSTAAGFEAHLVKPVDAQALIDVIERKLAGVG